MSDRPRDGFIRPDGSWLYDEHNIGDHHFDLAMQELREKKWRVGFATKQADFPEIAELLRRGYVRAVRPYKGECNYEVWNLTSVGSEARAEMELHYLSSGCREVLIDQIVGGLKRITPTYSVGGLGSYLRRGPKVR